jgi:tetratricopeptide (TPR) repeat protein
MPLPANQSPATAITLGDPIGKEHHNMYVEVIDDLHQLEEMKLSWEAVYTSDPDAQFFLSWTWMHGWLSSSQAPWLVIVAKPKASASPVAFFPLHITLEQDADGFYDDIFSASRGMADYTGLICRPEHTEEAIAAIARYIVQDINWSSLQLGSYLESDRKMALLLSHFSDAEFRKQEEKWDNHDNINLHSCPYIPLPEAWEDFLQNTVSPNTRQKLRRLFRKLEISGEFRITHTNADNLHQHIDILLQFWRTKWGPQKGERTETLVARQREMLQHCGVSQHLFLPVLWEGDMPLGALGILIDTCKKALFFLIAGRDETVKHLPPGLILHAYSIRYAIENGFRVYDFLRGDEPYKFYFGSKERFVKNIIVQRNSGTTPSRRLDRRIFPIALQVAAQLMRDNQVAEAERGYRQVLEIEPDHPEALYDLGILTAQKGEYETARTLLQILLERHPDLGKVWFGLGSVHEGEGQYSEAVKAYRQALAYEPDAPIIYNSLGRTLQLLGQWDEAVESYQKALDLQPGYVEAEVNQANTLHLQDELPPEKLAHYAALNIDFGDLCKAIGDLDSAAKYYRHAIAMMPDLECPHYHLGLVLQEQEEFAAAMASYQKALELKPDYDEAHAQLGKLREVCSGKQNAA